MPIISLCDLFTWTADVQGCLRRSPVNKGIVVDMTRKEQLRTFVFCGALAEDLRSDAAQGQSIAHLAMQIPEDKIPQCPANAAKVFLAYCSGRTNKPFNWMFPD